MEVILYIAAIIAAIGFFSFMCEHWYDAIFAQINS